MGTASAPATKPDPPRAQPQSSKAPRTTALLSVLSALLLMGSALVLLEVGVTAFWQDPFSALYARLTQDRLGGDLGRLERLPPTPQLSRQLRAVRTEPARISLLARTLRRTARPGAAVGRIAIPSIGARFVLVNGTDTDTLKKGPGIYPQTPFPGADGTTAIAGHRTTYLAPFRHIDRLRKGESIRIQMPYGDFTYLVQQRRIVQPTDIGVIRPVGYDRLVLSACDPPFSAARRIVIFARLVRRIARGPAFPGAPGDPAFGVSGPSVALLVLVICAMVATPPLLSSATGRLRARRR